jgi:uncharacterized protein YbjT (DUF2867 family)
MSKIALLFGSGGLTGNELLNQLLTDERYTCVKLFNRHPVNVRHNKVEEYIIDFNNLPTFAQLLTGDVIFCCLGTTIRKAGTKEAFCLVDYEYPKQIAALTSANGVLVCCVMSAIGANAKSSNFYLRTKGEMEEAVSNNKFDQTVFIRPSLILGDRKESRTGEKIGKALSVLISPLLGGVLSRYKPVQAKDIAAAMRNMPCSSYTKPYAYYNDIMVLSCNI